MSTKYFALGHLFYKQKSVDLYPALPSIIVRDMKNFEKYYGSFYFPGGKKIIIIGMVKRSLTMIKNSVAW